MNKKKRKCFFALLSLFLIGCNNDKELIIDGGGGCQHEYGPWEVVENSTCSRKGFMVAACYSCGKERVKTIGYDLEKGHSFDTSKWEYDKTGHWNPTKCGHTDVKGFFSPHTYQEWILVDLLLENNEAKISRCCSTCGYTETVIVPIDIQ